jgi:hypothetical protein
MAQLNDLSRSLTSLEPDSTIIAVIEMSMTASWSGPDGPTEYKVVAR